MKIPPLNSRGRTVLSELMKAPATFYEGIARHGYLNASEQKVRDIYQLLEVNGCLIKSGATYAVSLSARLALTPRSDDDSTAEPAPPAYRGDMLGTTLTAASARRTGAVFGLNFRR